MPELTSLQMRVLAAIETLGRLPIDARGRPGRRALAQLARTVGEDPETVTIVLDSLLAHCALVEESLEFDGIEPIGWWSVHPQLLQN